MAAIATSTPPIDQLFRGMPVVQLDGNGQAVATVDLSSLSLPPGLLTIYVAAVVASGPSTWAVTSNTVAFPN